MRYCFELNEWPGVVQAVQNVELHKRGFFSPPMANFFKSLRFALSLQMLLVTVAAPWLAWSHDQSKVQKAKGAERREVRIPIQDFTLTDQSAHPFKFQSLRGKVVIIDFAYTTCPDICPLLTASMRQVQDGLHRDERGATFFVTVTTDPEIDSPKVMAAYAKRYGVDPANWAFLTGNEPALKKVWKNFGVGVKRIARGLIDHTSLTAIVDQSGTVRVAYVGAAPDPKAILQDVRKFLRGN
jgi:protein SCO1/2